MIEWVGDWDSAKLEEDLSNGGLSNFTVKERDTKLIPEG